jgi:hypothetical protein
MTVARHSLLLAALQLLIVLSLGAKLLYDRQTRPRVWVLAQVYDPNLPIRGRYLSEQLHVPAEGFTYEEPPSGVRNYYTNRQWAHLEIRNDQLIAVPTGVGSAEWVNLQKRPDGSLTAVCEEPVLFFIPDNANIPPLKRGQETWIEVTVPAKGPPRPLRLGIKENGSITPLALN